MELMMYLPKMDEDTAIIAKRVHLLGDHTTGWHNGSENAIRAYNELLGMGKYITGHLLNAWENPPMYGEFFSLSEFNKNLNRLLVKMIEREDLTLSQLQRYRRLITSEKM